MYVVPFSMGPLGSAHRPHRRAAHRLALRRRVDADHDPHGPGRPRRARRRRVGARASTRSATRSSTPTATPGPTSRGRATPTTSTSPTSPRPARSGRTARATAATPCSARSASPCASPRRWPATTAGWPSTCSSSASPTPRARRRYVAAAFPSACGKTNMAMLIPTLPGWKVETVGDDIAWMKFGADGRLYAINPEAGFFGVAPGTGETDQPQRHAPRSTATRIFTNVAKTDDGDIWWEGLTDETPGPPHRLEGQRLDARVRHARPPTPTPASPPRRRSARRSPPSGRTPPACRSRHPVRRPPRHQRPAGDRGVRLAARHVPRLDHELGEDRRRRRHHRRGPLRPLRHAAVHGLQRRRLHATTGSRSASATDADKLPKLFWVNWFRKGDDGKFLWPGFGENSRVLKWVLERVDGHRRRRRHRHRPRPDHRCARHRRPRHRRRHARPSCSPSTTRPGGARSR